MQTETCVIIPCFQGEGSVAAVVAGCREHLETVIVIDDGSTDRTSVVAEQCGGRVVRHQQNLGKGAALITGLRQAQALGFSAALALDADFAEVHIDLAKIYGDRLGEPKKAIEHCCSYLRLRTDGAHASIAKEIVITCKEAMGK